jgi:hypothetical protein
MAPKTAFESHIEGGLEVYGIEADETERAVMKGVFELYRPALELLLEYDLESAPEERQPDLSRPPES